MAADPEQSDAPIEPAVVRVTTSGVRGRPRARPPGSRGIFIWMSALIAALLVGGSALRTNPQTAVSTPGFDGAEAVGATDDATIGPTPTEPITTELGTTPSSSHQTTVAPTLVPTEAATPRPTKKPPKADPTPYVEPTDSQYTEWTPPPGFVGSVMLSDNCHHANGREEVLMQADFNSPVEVYDVMFYADGDWVAKGGPPVGQELVGTVIVGREFEVGTTIVVEARFLHGEQRIHLIAKVKSEPFLVSEGPPCPGG
jgi:hypothetical protein